ncbi:MAG TPA: aldehyde dehydrogenase family protein, partial [Hellea balneolensis]|nr:aldehyde dehydrogenase family protein [Hellea balneolensis]
MKTLDQHYIDGQWVASSGTTEIDVINPATEEVCAKLVPGTSADVDKAVLAAKTAFETYSQTSREERLALLDRVIGEYQTRMGDLAAAITEEMGAPKWLAGSGQAGSGLGHLITARKVLENYEFHEQRGNTHIQKEPIGVCGFITPWNWPVNQIACKVAPALAVGCTVVLKPSEIAPLSAHLFSEMIHEAGYPAGVFNLVDGDGDGVGSAISAHPGIDM